MISYQLGRKNVSKHTRLESRSLHMEFLKTGKKVVDSTFWANVEMKPSAIRCITSKKEQNKEALRDGEIFFKLKFHAGAKRTVTVLSEMYETAICQVKTYPGQLS